MTVVHICAHIFLSTEGKQGSVISRSTLQARQQSISEAKPPAGQPELTLQIIPLIWPCALSGKSLCEMDQHFSNSLVSGFLYNLKIYCEFLRAFIFVGFIYQYLPD